MGLLFADILDFSAGPSVAMFLGVALVLSALPKILRRSLAATMIGLVILGFGALLFLGHPDRLSVKTDSDISRLTGAEAVGETTPPASELHALEAVLPEDIADMNNLREIENLFKKAPDADVASAIVCRALELDPRTGARLALNFLESDSPFFFRQQVIVKLDEFMDQAAGFDPEEPFNKRVNQKAAAKVKKLFDLK
jgi:hypothetical protein